MISIIIRTYNESKYLSDLLDMISIQDYVNFEVIIVDSGSTDNTLDIANDKKYNFIKIYSIDKSDFTFGYSLNYGIERSKGDLCVMISGHCIPKNETWLNNLIEPFKDDKVGISYGKQIGNDDITKFSEYQIFKSWYPNKPNLKQTSSPFCNNANGCVKKEVWERLGGYDERSQGLEDILFADKMLKNTNMYISYSSDSIVYHIHNESWEQIQNRYYRESITYSSINLTEDFTLFDFIKLSIINISHDIKQLFKSDKSITTTHSIFLFRLNQFWGTYRGYRYTKKYNEMRNKLYFPE